MTSQHNIHYERIEKAIGYIQDNFRMQPSLEEIAKAINVSPYHFHRIFSEWAGVSPKKFVQYIGLEYAKQMLAKQYTIMETAAEIGLSGPSRLHDMFISIEGMTPGEFKNGGAKLNINYCFATSPFGKLIVATTSKGVCQMFFEESEDIALSELQTRFPNATFNQFSDTFQQNVLSIFREDWNKIDQIKLHLAGTPFQLKVWESLLNIPFAALATYGDIAQTIGKPKSSRAVGTAIGKNPVALLIPCHRIIQSSGKIGGYMWGPNKKSAIIGWEAARASVRS